MGVWQTVHVGWLKEVLVVFLESSVNCVWPGRVCTQSVVYKHLCLKCSVVNKSTTSCVIHSD